MAGKFMRRNALVDSVKSEHRTNAVRKRNGLTRHPISGHVCQCPDPTCGVFHLIRTERAIPTPEEAVAALAADKKRRKQAKKNRRRSTH